MSGGAIYNVQPDINDIRLAGIALSGGSEVLRFYPAYHLLDAILSYRSCSCENIDPSADVPLSEETMLELFGEQLERLGLINSN